MEASISWINVISSTEKELTCRTDTNEIADPVSDGGWDNLAFGLAEYAEGDAERTFKT